MLCHCVITIGYTHCLWICMYHFDSIIVVACKLIHLIDSKGCPTSSHVPIKQTLHTFMQGTRIMHLGHGQFELVVEVEPLDSHQVL